MAHSRPANRTGLEQMRIFIEEGVDPATVQIAHTGDSDSVDYCEELLQTGCFVGMDRYGLDLFNPQQTRNDVFVALVERGHADRMTLSQDYVAFLDWFPPEAKPVLAPDWSMTFIFETAIPQLLERGVTQEQIDAMLGTNVHRWLAAGR